uniref:Uncharacterized protein n=1 Tax=Anguilla anguilla TaxID=7936 RepID=A0A0E9R4L2_ANGAN
MREVWFVRFGKKPTGRWISRNRVEQPWCIHL